MPRFSSESHLVYYFGSCLAVFNFMAASIEWWKEPLGFDGSALASATVVVHALSPIVDTLLLPRGEWVSVTPMLISLPPGESQNVATK